MTYRIVTTNSSTVSPPQISVSNIANGKNTTISCSTSDAKIHCTTNGTTPTTASPVYSGGISFTSPGTYTIKAIAVKSGMTNSDVSTQTFTLEKAAAVTANPSDGAVVSGTTVALSTTTDFAEIRYTTDGSDPTLSADSVKIYNTPILILFPI